MPGYTPNNDTAIVPFGKYQGQPIEALLADQNYLQWVTSQPGLMAMLQTRASRATQVEELQAGLAYPHLTNNRRTRGDREVPRAE